MRSTKKITISAMMCALSVVILALGAVFEALDLTAAALASICIAFVYIEVGAPYTFIAWICTTLLSFLFFPQSLLWIEYLLLFGLVVCKVRILAAGDFKKRRFRDAIWRL